MIRFLQRHRGAQGSVTILMLIIMLPMLVFSFTIVDVCKIFMAKDVAADASNLALNAGMTSYDKVLKDVYGIMATSKSEDDLAKKMSEYYEATLAANGLKSGDVDSSALFSTLLGSIDDVDSKVFDKDSSYLKVSPVKVGGSSVSVDAFDSSAASNPAVMERQIVEYMKYRGPLHMAEGIFDKLNALKDLPNQSNVTKERMTFEQKLGDINNDLIDIYTKIQVFMYNNERAETGNSTFSIVYESEKTKIIDKYKYSGSSYPANGIFENGTAIKNIEDKLKKASAAVILYAPFYDLMEKPDPAFSQINDGSYSYGSNYAKLAKDLKDRTDILKKADFGGGMDFEDAAKALSSYRSTANTFFNDMSSVEAAFKLMLAIKGLSKYYRSGKGGDSTSDIAKYIQEFRACYSVAKKVKLDKVSDNDKKTFKDARDAANELNTKLESALSDMESAVKELSSQANKQLTDACSRANEMYGFLNRQIKLIDDLNDKDLDNLMKAFADAKAQANGSYKNAISKVESDNQQNSAQQTWDREAKEIAELQQADVDALKKLLKDKREYYVKVKEALTSLKVMSELQNQPPAAFKVSGDSIKLVNDRIEKYATDEVLEQPMSANALSIHTGNLPDYTHKGEKLGISKWTANDRDTEGSIAKNKAYKEIEKLSTPQRKTEKDDSEKKKVMENSKTSSSTDGDNSTLPGGVDAETKNPDGSEKSESEKAADKEAFEKMRSAARFSEYIKTSEEASAVIPKTATISDSDMSVDANCDTSGSDKDVSNNAMAMMDNVANLMSKIGDILKDGRDALFVTEYLTGNFSCHTTSMDGKGKRLNNAEMLSGELFYKKGSDGKETKNVAYGTELEYILYGLDSELANKAAAGGTIFGVRFVLNLIYSFTDAEIRNFTFSVASAAAGWFPFAVPIVQTVLHIGLALAESAVDLTYLMQGAAVPLYKSTNTWYCKGTNIIRNVVGEVVNAAAGVAIDAAADALCEGISNAADGAKDWVKEKEKYVQEKIDEVRGQIQTNVLSPVNEVVQDCMLNISTLASEGEAAAKKKIKEKLETAFASLETSLVNQAELTSSEDEDNAVNDVTKAILNELKGKLDTISGEIYNNLETLAKSAEEKVSVPGTNETFGSLSEKVQEKMTTVTNTINSYIGKAGEYADKAAGKAKEFVEKLSGKIGGAIDSVAEEVKKGVNYTADELKSAINSKVSASVTGHKNTTIINTKGKTTTSAEHMLDMTYQDYMYVFTLIAVFANRDNILERAALLMQANCRVRGASDDYDLNKARTFFAIEVGASTSTVFYGAVFKNRKLDMSGARKKYEFTYKSYMGY